METGTPGESGKRSQPWRTCFGATAADEHRISRGRPDGDGMLSLRRWPGARRDCLEIGTVMGDSHLHAPPRGIASADAILHKGFRDSSLPPDLPPRAPRAR